MVSLMIATSSISILSDVAADPSHCVECARSVRELFFKRPSQIHSDKAATETDSVRILMRSGAAQSTENVCFAIQERKLATMHCTKNRRVAQERSNGCTVQHEATKRKRKERQPVRKRVQEDWEKAEIQSLKLFQEA